MNAKTALFLRVTAHLPGMVSRFQREELAVNLTDDGSVRALISAESTDAVADSVLPVTRERSLDH